jgi:hypothetical protein
MYFFPDICNSSFVQFQIEYIHVHLFYAIQTVIHVLVTIYSITTLALRISKIIMLSNTVIHECTLAHE